jgi:dTDP-4-dehydrorhamnose 3,5-epimerase-like enzyme
VDWFVIVSGSAKFRFFDDIGNEQTVVVSDKKLCRITVPVDIWHGWCPLEDNTLLVSIASEPYMGYGRKGDLDEERIPHNYFDGDEDGWAVQPR